MKNAAALYKRVMEDQETRDRLLKMTGRGEVLDEIIRLGMEYGLPVTRDEILQFLSMNSGGEMSDQELESVVGGKGSIHEEIKGDGSLASQFMALFGNYTSSAHNDNLSGGEGNDSMWGGYGSDSMDGGTGNDSMDGGWGPDDEYDGGDTMNGGAGNDTMWGGLGNDSMDGGEDNDYMDGGEDNDTMDGGAGNDTMYGGAGDDYMDGGAGNDRMEGGAGNDTLTGGEGADTFVFGRDSGSDTITDFNPNEDKFYFQGLNSANEIDVASAGGKTFITYGDTTITLEGVEMDKDQVLGCMD